MNRIPSHSSAVGSRQPTICAPPSPLCFHGPPSAQRSSGLSCSGAAQHEPKLIPRHLSKSGKLSKARRLPALALFLFVFGLLTTQSHSSSRVTVMEVFDPGIGQLLEGIAVDALGNTYLGMLPRGELWKIEPGGKPAAIAAFGAGTTLGLHADAAGNVYAAFNPSDENAPGQVWRVAPEGTKSLVGEMPDSGTLNDLTVDAEGTVYVTDSALHRIYRIPYGEAASQWLSHPSLEKGDCPHPFGPSVNGIAFDPQGRLFVANTTAGSIVEIPILSDGSAGEPLIVAGPDCSLNGADGIVFDESGMLYIGLNIQNQVVRLNVEDGAMEVLATESDGLRFPATLAFGAGRNQHDLFVANIGVSSMPPEPRLVRIQVPPPPNFDVEVTETFDPGTGQLPEGIAIDGGGNIYFGLLPRGELWKIEPGGEPAAFAALGEGQILGLHATRDGTVYAAFNPADTTAPGQVWRVAPDGTPTLAGEGPDSGTLNDLTVDSQGTVYVTDSEKGRVYRIAASGEASLWLTHPLLEKGTCPHPFGPSVNGIALDPRGRLFVANTTAGSIVQIPILADGSAGPPVVVAGPDCSLAGADGIAFDEFGWLYVGLNIQNRVVRLNLDDGMMEVLATEASGLRFPATLAFGAGPLSRDDLYVANIGVTFDPPLPRLTRIGVRNPSTVVRLPDEWGAEGIAVGPGPSLYAGSRLGPHDGAVYKIDLASGDSEILVPAQAGRKAVGMKLDPRTDQLFAGGGATGAAYVYDGATGETLNTFQFASESTFVNDVVITPDAAYFTDTLRPYLYRVPLLADGRLPEPASFEEIQVGGDFAQAPGFNLNGIVSTPDGQWLIVVPSATGVAYRVNPRSGLASKIDLGGATLLAADGLLLDGRLLYVTQNRLNKISVVALDPATWTSGAIVHTIESSQFNIPTTIAFHGSSILAVNGQVGLPVDGRSYQIVEVPAPVIPEIASRINRIQALASHERFLSFDAPAFNHYDVEVSSDLEHWTPLRTVPGARTEPFTYNFRTSANQIYGLVDEAAPFLNQRFYRTVQPDRPNAIAGDHLLDDNGASIVFTPIDHASLVIHWESTTIYADPVGGGARYNNVPPPDLIVITHQHGDHYHADTLNAVVTPATTILAPQSVFDLMPASLQSLTTVVANGTMTEAAGVSVEAIPAYNLTPDRLQRHPKGRDNGYVLTLGAKRIYISSDTEDIPEMRALKNIDVAFVCMNPPFTMDIEQAAGAVREFQPRVVYPFHFNAPTVLPGNVFVPTEPQTQDVVRFKELVGTDLGIEVRLRKWYANHQIGETLPAEQAGIALRPLNHASVLLSWAGKTIYADPAGGSAEYESLSKADLVLVTHLHNDHYDANRIEALRSDQTVIIAPQTVFDLMPSALQAITTVMANGEAKDLSWVSVEAIPAYNITPGRGGHPKGRDNGYVLTLGGKRIYVSGDTEDTPEMRALQNIDVAFLSMSIPSNMSVDQAASAIRAFDPGIVYPYHFFNARPGNFHGIVQDVTKLKRLIGEDVNTEVRMRRWYFAF